MIELGVEMIVGGGGGGGGSVTDKLVMSSKLGLVGERVNPLFLLYGPSTI